MSEENDVDVIDEYSFFKKSVCCLCTKSIFDKIGMTTWISVINALCLFISYILLSIHFIGESGFTTINHARDLAGIIMFSIGYSIYFLSVVPPFKYLLDSKNGTWFGIPLSLYIISGLHVIFAIPVIFYGTTSYGDIAEQLTYAIKCADATMLYTSVIIFIWYWIYVFRPIFPDFFYASKINFPAFDMPYEARREFHSDSSKSFLCLVYCFWEFDKTGYKNSSISSINLQIMFGYCFIVLNALVGRIDIPLEKYIISTCVVFGWTLSILIVQLIIYILYKKDGGFNNLMDHIHIGWIITASICAVPGLVLFFVFLPYSGWDVNPNNYNQSMIRNIYYIVQGVPSIIIAFYWISYAISKCCMCTANTLQSEISDARSQVEGYTQNDE